MAIVYICEHGKQVIEGDRGMLIKTTGDVGSYIHVIVDAVNFQYEIYTR